MKKIIISIIFVFTLIIGCIVYVASASVDSLNDIEANTEKPVSYTHLKKLVILCNSLDIEECHIDDIVEDFLTDFKTY